MIKEIDVRERMMSLWPSTWDQKHNRFRSHCIEKTADELTGDDYNWYNEIIDAVNNDDHRAFVKAVMRHVDE